MPFYLCTRPAGSLDAAARERIAQEITNIHCQETGAPAEFCHVAFVDSREPDADAFSVLGTIRAGRSDETKTAIRTRMARAVAENAGVAAERVAVNTVDVPAAWVMEGGALLPEPGAEGDWLAAHGA